MRETQKLVIQLVEAPRAVPALRTDWSQWGTCKVGVRISHKWEELGNDNPGDWAPRVTKVEDVEPDKDGGCPSCALVLVPVVLVTTSECTDNDETERHAETTSDGERSPSKAVDEEERWEGGDEHADTDNTRCKEGNSSATNAKALKDGRSVEHWGQLRTKIATDR